LKGPTSRGGEEKGGDGREKDGGRRRVVERSEGRKGRAPLVEKSWLCPCAMKSRAGLQHNWS